MALGPGLGGFLSVYLPWVLVPRLTFIYHYFTAVPFLVLALLALFQQLSRRGPLARTIRLGGKGELPLSALLLGVFAPPAWPCSPCTSR